MVIKLEESSRERLKQSAYVRRCRIYRRFLYLALAAGIVGIVFLGYKNTYDKIPANIKLKAGVEQTLDLKVPVNGEIVKVPQNQIGRAHV